MSLGFGDFGPARGTVGESKTERDMGRARAGPRDPYSGAMAEIRKFKPGAGGEIAQALAKAMGEGVRPATPGAAPEPPKPKKVVKVGPTATSGAIWDPFLKSSPRAKASKPAAEPGQNSPDKADGKDEPTTD